MRIVPATLAMAPPPPSKRFAVLQLGARMHYAVPALLKRAGMLQHFYTDAVGNVGLTDVLRRLTPEWARPAPARRLLGRRLPPELSRDDVTTAQSLAIFDGLQSHGKTPAARRPLAPDWLRWHMQANAFHGANALYCLDPGDVDMMKNARDRGMFIVYEQIIAPHVGRILREERLRHPGFEKQDSAREVEAGIRLDKQIWDLADIVLAPSDFVRDAMIELGADPHRVRLVPYGLSENWFTRPPRQPQAGRVLFVGGVGLRKGNHILAAATRLLQQRGVPVEVRVVGPYDPKMIAAPLFAGPTYVGQVPRSEVREEFLQADVFAFPTLAEGFALAHLEAMACGVPVVTTPNCGPATRDGQDGFIVEPRDAVGLADRIEAIVRDRALRDRLAQSARKQATNFSWGHYQHRLLAALDPSTTELTEKRAA
jgi:glycosyltransferase involved in cell wall biosynthesis